VIYVVGITIFISKFLVFNIFRLTKIFIMPS